MTELSWRDVQRVKVEAKPAGLWNMVLPYVPGPRLLRLTILDKDEHDAPLATKWNISPNSECGPDGILNSASRSGLLVSSAPWGALVGKVGGSTVDLPESGGTYSGKKVFAVGSYAVVPLASTDAGPLFLTMNDVAELFATHSGALWISIEEAPL